MAETVTVSEVREATERLDRAVVAFEEQHERHSEIQDQYSRSKARLDEARQEMKSALANMEELSAKAGNSIKVDVPEPTPKSQQENKNSDANRNEEAPQ